MSMPDPSPTLPPQTRTALDRLDAPRSLTTTAQVADWATEHLGFAFTCCLPGDGTTRGAVRHWVRVDPYTGATSTEPPPTRPLTPTQVHRIDAEHTLWALAHPAPPPCTQVGVGLPDWVGEHPGRLPIPKTLLPRMLAVRTVLRTVDWAAAGHDPAEYPGWFRLGATAANVTNLLDLVANCPVPRPWLGGRILNRVRARVGGPGQPYAGVMLYPCADDVDVAVYAWFTDWRASRSGD